MRTFEPDKLSPREINGLLLGGVAPRPIALVSTLSSDGIRNLSPFSFFNAFGVNPPVVAFSPSRRVRNGSVKDTYNNLLATRECVIQSVTYAMVQQISLASTEYPSEVDEFLKSGLTPISSDLVKPFRVKESPFQMECVLRQMMPLGNGNGSGNLAICDVVRIHVAEDVFVNGVIEPDLMDLVGRNSADYYTRASGGAIITVKKPGERLGIGYDQIPESIRQSRLLTANNLGQLGGIDKMPSAADIALFVSEHPPIEGNEMAFRMAEQSCEYKRMFQIARYIVERNGSVCVNLFELAARCALDCAGDRDFAWHALLYSLHSVTKVSTPHH